MKLYNKFIWIITVLILVTGCDKFDDINTNPDKSTTAPSSLLATGLIKSVIVKGGGKDFVYDMLISKHIAWNESAINEQYNRFGKRGFSEFTTLVNCYDVIDKAADVNKDGYTGLALYVKAHTLYYSTLRLGDIPCSEAAKGEEGIIKPKYDTQKEVMLTILNDLDEAYASLNRANEINAGSGVVFEGDPIFGGNRESWKKVVTAFQLKVLLNLSKKESDTDLNIRERFAKIVNERSLMTSNSDNFKMTYAAKAGMNYPLNINTSNQAKYAMLSSFLVDMLKEYEDYRLFAYAEPTIAEKEKGTPEDSFDAYYGVDPSAPYDDVVLANGKGECSTLNLRYTSLDYQQGEPMTLLGYAEQQLILAEACLRGWISGDASTYYKNGIKASLEYVREYTPEAYSHGRVITNDYVTNYLAQSAIQLTGNFEKDLELIMKQKYMASFLQYPYECYFDYRRTGYPVLPINPETNQNTKSDRIPVRYMYADSEYSYNRENLDEALARQFNGNDEVNELMWILK